jgi:hypothetical protein
MAYYDLSPTERAAKALYILQCIQADIEKGSKTHLLHYFADEDTYIRKNAYLAIGKIYLNHKNLRSKTIQCLKELMEEVHYHIRQTVVNAAGEIGKYDFALTEPFFDTGLFDTHHTVRNAVIGSIKKMGEKMQHRCWTGVKNICIMRIKRYAAKFAMV